MTDTEKSRPDVSEELALLESIHEELAREIDAVYALGDNWKEDEDEENIVTFTDHFYAKTSLVSSRIQENPEKLPLILPKWLQMHNQREAQTPMDENSPLISTLCLVREQASLFFATSICFVELSEQQRKDLVLTCFEPLIEALASNREFDALTETSQHIDNLDIFFRELATSDKGPIFEALGEVDTKVRWALGMATPEGTPPPEPS